MKKIMKAGENFGLSHPTPPTFNFSPFFQATRGGALRPRLCGQGAVLGGRAARPDDTGELPWLCCCVICHFT